MNVLLVRDGLASRGIDKPEEGESTDQPAKAQEKPPSPKKGRKAS